LIPVVLWIVALFFAGGWSFGLIALPDQRVKSTVVSVVYWWVEIATVFLAGLHPAHLLWLMPLALFIPMIVMQSLLLTPNNTVGRIFVLSGVVLGPALAALFYFSG
jgi:hypothetical protein